MTTDIVKKTGVRKVARPYNFGTLEAAYEHRADIKALNWEFTHREWTGEPWQLDFAALDIAVEHFLNRGYSVTIAASDLSIFLSDYDAPFLEVHLPDATSCHPMSKVTVTTMNRPISVRSRSVR